MNLVGVQPKHRDNMVDVFHMLDSFLHTADMDFANPLQASKCLLRAPTGLLTLLLSFIGAQTTPQLIMVVGVTLMIIGWIITTGNLGLSYSSILSK